MGNYETALIHLRSGLQILKELRDSKSPSSSFYIKEFSPIIMGLGVQSCLFLNPWADANRMACWQELKISIPERTLTQFSTIEDAHFSLSTIGAECIHDRNPTSHIRLPLSDMRLKHIRLLMTWENCLKTYLSKLNPADPTIDIILRGASLLKAMHIMISIVVNSTYSSSSQFREIITLCKTVASAQLTYTSTPGIFNFSSELGIIAPLFFTAMKCQNLELRCEAWEVLKAEKRREGMWDSDLCAVVIGRILSADPPNDDTLRDLLEARNKFHFDGFHPESLAGLGDDELCWDSHVSGELESMNGYKIGLSDGTTITAPTTMNKKANDVLKGLEEAQEFCEHLAGFGIWFTKSIPRECLLSYQESVLEYT